MRFAVFWRISVRFCGFRTPLTPPSDRDDCYYNDFCYRVSNYDIPFNLMSSNFVYIEHAFILALSVWYMESELLARCKKIGQPQPLPVTENAECNSTESTNKGLQRTANGYDEERGIYNSTEAHKRKISFSIGYAFSWALLFEGLFSMLYHCLLYTSDAADE